MPFLRDEDCGSVGIRQISPGILLSFLEKNGLDDPARPHDIPDALLTCKDMRRATEARVMLSAAVFPRRNRDRLCPVWPWAGERPLPSWLFVSALALLEFAWSGTRWSADGQSGLAHPRPSVLCRRPVAGTLTLTAIAFWPQTNAAGHFPFPVRGRARFRRPWWRCLH